ncbi:hypothetical protein B9T31_05525 [Acinetobacter sp. ANC 4558]|uniref:molybdenum cofactor biosynthesis protein MoaE n=1 Tax=Acinetobacter sp. ANC 4558 TaxID=1977876 RepID=UPI000A355231|nr:molybdenum cofactor biosynthesis protein MoaE [Acinetobacter sp. ANC 4558]OTG87069.1 hypothetical protein B9T31_05525 [Acinetobacter sp. ANC 4558]
MNLLIQIENDTLNIKQYQKFINSLNHDYGAQVTFTGYVRKHDYAESITYLYIEHYPQVTEQEIKNIVQRAQQQWLLEAVVVAHRVGNIAVGEPIVWVMTQSKHRLDAYAANEFIMDYLKVSAPFWKKESFQNGHECWVNAKDYDQEKFKKWVN